jgi:hypothetical protein
MSRVARSPGPGVDVRLRGATASLLPRAGGVGQAGAAACDRLSRPQLREHSRRAPITVLATWIVRVRVCAWCLRGCEAA